MSTLHLHPPAPTPHDYSIIVEPDAIDQLPALIATLGTYDSIIILYDENLNTLATHIETLFDRTHLISVPSGEASKSLDEVGRITQRMLDAGASRKSLLISVGGGMLTDLGGFIASIYMRGIDSIYVSTSLLGMVDASVGGKTGIDVGTTKNILGTFAHPKAIIIDTAVLGSLPDQQLCEGIVEVIKMAIMLSEEDTVWLEEHIDAILDRDASALQECIERAVKMKVDVVEADEKESGKRKLLNFGHTIGHAIEANSNFQLSHGKAVSIGMIAEMKALETSVELLDRLKRFLEHIAMPTNLPTDDPQVLWDIMLNDKKTSGGTVYVSVPNAVGEGSTLELTKESFLTLYK